jgi:hypothetical protein
MGVYLQEPLVGSKQTARVLNHGFIFYLNFLRKIARTSLILGRKLQNVDSKHFKKETAKEQ